VFQRERSRKCLYVCERRREGEREGGRKRKREILKRGHNLPQEINFFTSTFYVYAIFLDTSLIYSSNIDF
jgi:hypothetical protein